MKYISKQSCIWELKFYCWSSDILESIKYNYIKIKIELVNYVQLMVFYDESK